MQGLSVTFRSLLPGSAAGLLLASCATSAPQPTGPTANLVFKTGTFRDTTFTTADAANCRSTHMVAFIDSIFHREKTIQVPTSARYYLSYSATRTKVTGGETVLEACEASFSFIPAENTGYDIQAVTDGKRCGIVIRDGAGARPASMKTYDLTTGNSRDSLCKMILLESGLTEK